MSKQDRQGVRTPADLEQKYNFGRSFAEVQESARAAGTAAQKAQSTAERANEAAREAKTEILKLSDSITLSVTDGEPGHTAMIKLKVGEKEYTGQIDMQGVVTFTSLETSGATEINGDNITTGSILADLIKAGVIKSKDGTSVVIDLDEGNVDLTGSIVTQKKQYEGFEQTSSVTPSGVTVGDTVSDFYTEVVAGAVRASAYGKAQSIFGVTPVYLDEGTVYYAVLTLRNMMNGNQWLKLSAQPDRTVITGLTAPVDDSDAANKGYVDKRIAHNYLDNSDFTNPVNQREYTSFNSVNGYFIDRWRTSSASIFSLTGGLKITSGHAFQFVPADTLKDGQTYTVACKVGNSVLCYSGKKLTTFGNWDSGLIASYDSSTGCYKVYLTATDARYEWAALYEGEYTADTLPPYKPKGYAAELAECMRYYQRTFPDNNPKTTQNIQIAFGANANWIQSISFAQPMRCAPTVTLYNNVTGNAKEICEWNNDAPVSGVTAGCIGNRGFAPLKSGGIVTNKSYGFHYEASADL